MHQLDFVQRIEQEFDEPATQVVDEFLNKPDYLGCVLSRYDIEQMFKAGRRIVTEFIRKNNIPFTIQNYKAPSRLEDECWVKYGVSLERYLKTRCFYLTQEEMALQLNTRVSYIKKLMRKNGLTCRYEDKWVNEWRAR